MQINVIQKMKSQDHVQEFVVRGPWLLAKLAACQQLPQALFFSLKWVSAMGVTGVRRTNMFRLQLFIIDDNI